MCEAAGEKHYVGRDGISARQARTGRVNCHKHVETHTPLHHRIYHRRPGTGVDPAPK